MSSTATIPSHRARRIRKVPLQFAKRGNFSFSVSGAVIAEENTGGPAWEQKEQAVIYSDPQVAKKLLQFAMFRRSWGTLLSSEPGELSSEEYSSCPQYCPPEEFPELFQLFASIWRNDTKHLSDLTQICNHWAYQLIIKMGRPVIPLLLQELKTNPDYWFSALRKITGENPVPAEARGKLTDMTSAWLEWAKSYDYSR